MKTYVLTLSHTKHREIYDYLTKKLKYKTITFVNTIKKKFKDINKFIKYINSNKLNLIISASYIVDDSFFQNMRFVSLLFDKSLKWILYEYYGYLGKTDFWSLIERCMCFVLHDVLYRNNINAHDTYKLINMFLTYDNIFEYDDIKIYLETMRHNKNIVEILLKYIYKEHSDKLTPSEHDIIIKSINNGEILQETTAYYYDILNTCKKIIHV